MKYKSDIVYLALGSNLRILPFRNVMQILESVKIKIPRLGLRVIDTSKNWQTNPIPFKNIPKFINCVIKCLIVNKQVHNPHVLLEKIKSLEFAMGRKKNIYNFSRVIDIDILDFRGEVLNDNLILPHPRMHLRKFVLNPMNTIARNWKHPIFRKKIDYLVAKIKTKEQLIEKL